MKRRQALQQLGVGLSAGLLAPHLFTSCKKENLGPAINYKGSIAVIGAGAAGLYAADILTAQGLNVFVLEATNRNGGRVRSFSASDVSNDNSSDAFSYDYKNPPLADFPLELGGDIVYGTDSVLGKIITPLNIPLIDLATATDQYVLGGVVKTSADWGADADLTTVQNFLSTLSGQSTNSSIRDAAAVATRAQALLNGEVSNPYGSTSDLVSTAGVGGELALRTHDNKRLLVKTNTLQDILITRFDRVAKGVIFNAPVASIDYTGDIVTITDSNGKSYQANKVIVTVPLTVIKSNGINFNPALPSVNTSAAAKFGMDACVRVVLDFKKNFWGDAAGFIWGGNFGPQYMNGGYERGIYNTTLIVTAYGQPAQTLSSYTSLAIVNTLISELDALYPDPNGKYPGQATKYIRRKIETIGGVPQETDPIVTVYNWTKEPYIKGGISYPLVGSTHQDRIDLGASVSGKIFFAGEATDVSGNAGTISGALSSAERATEELIKSITG